MRKPRSDSALANLQPQQREALADQLLDGMSYADAKDWLHMEYGVETSASALAGFYQHFCAPLRLRRAADAANALPELSGGMMADWDAASVALVQQKYFEMLAAPAVNPKDLFSIGLLIADINKGKLEREKLRFNRQKTAIAERRKRRELRFSMAKFENQKFKVAEQTKKLREVGSKLSDDERKAIVAEIDRVMGI